jgi:hypothetical protein
MALAVVGAQGRTNLAGTLLGWDLHRFEKDAATRGARCRHGQRLGRRRDISARRAKPTPAAHAIFAASDLVRRPKRLDNVSLGFHGSKMYVKCRASTTSPRGFPGAAKGSTMTGMSWHHVPKDDAWKQAHLAMLERLGKRASLHCDGCRHIMIEPCELAQRHRFDMLTPLLTISKAMRCTRCGARKGCCWRGS